MSSAQIIKEAEKNMLKVIGVLKSDLAKLRTGRANTNLLEHIKVSSYGSEMLLSQVASVNAVDARTLSVTPWDKGLVEAIEKAIMQAELGVNPTTTGGVIRINLPSLTEERRKDMVRLVKETGEKSRVSIRNVRRDANQHLKNLEKDKQLSTDEEHRAEAEVQKLTDKMISQIDSAVQKKEQELMEI